MAEITISNDGVYEGELSALCLICGSSVPLSMEEQEALRYGHYEIKICEDCKNAIEWAKKKMIAETH